MHEAGDLMNLEKLSLTGKSPIDILRVIAGTAQVELITLMIHIAV